MCVSETVPSLVEVNEKHNVVPETGQSVWRWHGDDEGKHIVDEGIECLAKKEIKIVNQYKSFDSLKTK